MRLFVAVFPPAEVRADLRQTLTTIAPPEWQADARPRLGRETTAEQQADARTGLGREASSGRQADLRDGLGRETAAGWQADVRDGLGRDAMARSQADARTGLGREAPAGRHGLERAGLRLTPVERWHLTLVFLGEVADERLGEVERALDGVPDARRISREPTRGPAGGPGRRQPGRAIELRLAGAGRFDNRGSSALWTGVAGDLAGLSGLHVDLRAALALAGLPADERAFRPHLTIAYSRGGRATVALTDYAGPAWCVDEFVLVRSRVNEGGGYDHLGAWAC